MKTLTDIEILRARVLKSYRSAIRLKHSLLADEEMNRVLPEIAARFDAALQAGKAFELTAGEVFEVLEEPKAKTKKRK